MEDPQLVPHLVYESDTDFHENFLKKVNYYCTVNAFNSIHITL